MAVGIGLCGSSRCDGVAGPYASGTKHPQALQGTLGSVAARSPGTAGQGRAPLDDHVTRSACAGQKAFPALAANDTAAKGTNPRTLQAFSGPAPGGAETTATAVSLVYQPAARSPPGAAPALAQHDAGAAQSVCEPSTGKIAAFPNRQRRSIPSLRLYL